MPRPQTTPRQPIPPGWLTREQLAIKLDRSVSSIDKLTTAGRLPLPYRFGARCILYSEAEIDAHLTEQAAARQARRIQPAA